MIKKIGRKHLEAVFMAGPISLGVVLMASMFLPWKPASAQSIQPVMIKDINAHPALLGVPASLAEHNGRIYFEAPARQARAGLWSMSAAGGDLRYETALSFHGVSTLRSSSGPLFLAESRVGSPGTPSRIGAYFGGGSPVWYGPSLGSTAHFLDDRPIAVIGDKALFEGADSSVYRTDGSDAGTELIMAAETGLGFGVVLHGSLRSLGEHAIFGFRRDDEVTFYTQDASDHDPMALISVPQGPPYFSYSYARVQDGVYWYLFTDGNCANVKVVRSEGSPSDTTLWQNVSPGPGTCLGASNGFSVWKNRLYYYALESVFVIDLNKGQVEHVATLGGWVTNMTVLNDAIVLAVGSEYGRSLHRLVEHDGQHSVYAITANGSPVTTSPESPYFHLPFPSNRNRFVYQCEADLCSSTGEDNTAQVLVEAHKFSNHWPATVIYSNFLYVPARSQSRAAIVILSGEPDLSVTVANTENGTQSAFRYTSAPNLSRGLWHGNALIHGDIQLCDGSDGLGSSCPFGFMRSDGTAAGTTVLAQVHSDWRSTHNFGAADGRLLVSGDMAENGALVKALASLPLTLDATDSVIASGLPLHSFLMTVNAASESFVLTYCPASSSTSLCVTDPRLSSWMTILEGPAPCFSDAKPLITLGGRALFTARDCQIFPATYSLWSTDGLGMDVQKLADVWHCDNLFDPVEHQGHWYFCGADHLGPAVWRTDGSIDSTEKILNWHDVRSIASSGDLLYVLRSGTEFDQHELWRSDGAEIGTFLLASGSRFERLTAVDGRVHWIQEAPGIHSWKYWVSDGSIVGTHMIESDGIVSPAGEIVSVPHALRPADAEWAAILSCISESKGIELCVVNADGAGMTMITDIAPGPLSSGPHSFEVGPEAVFFKASDGWHGVELFRLDTDYIFVSGFE